MNEKEYLKRRQNDLETEYGLKVPMEIAAKELNISYHELSRRKYIPRFKLGKNVFFKPEVIVQQLGEALG